MHNIGDQSHSRMDTFTLPTLMGPRPRKGNPVAVVLLQNLQHDVAMRIAESQPPAAAAAVHAAHNGRPRTAGGRSQRALDRRWSFTALGGRWNTLDAMSKIAHETYINLT